MSEQQEQDKQFNQDQIQQDTRDEINNDQDQQQQNKEQQEQQQNQQNSSESQTDNQLQKNIQLNKDYADAVSTQDIQKKQLILDLIKSKKQIDEYKQRYLLYRNREMQQINNFRQRYDNVIEKKLENYLTSGIRKDYNPDTIVVDNRESEITAKNDGNMQVQSVQKEEDVKEEKQQQQERQEVKKLPKPNEIKGTIETRNMIQQQKRQESQLGNKFTQKSKWQSRFL